MYIATLSMVISQSKAQTAAGTYVIKIVMDNGKDNARQMTEMMQNAAVDLNAGVVFGEALTALEIDEYNTLC